MIEDRTDQQLQNFVDNYRSAGKTSGGLFTLSEVLLEKERRAGGSYEGPEVARLIFERSRKSEDGLVSYLELYQHYFPTKKWIGNNPGREVGKMMHAAAYYCVTHKLPIVTAIVVQSKTRQVTKQAKQNMFDAATDWGVEAGANAEAFYNENIKRLKDLSMSDFP